MPYCFKYRFQVSMDMDGNRPAVSVIIPAYRATEFIAEALDSVLAQTYRDYEIVVVNDGSPDTPALERVLAPYRHRIVYLKQENRGVSSARNAGIQASRASVVALLDADDAWMPGFLAVQMQMLEADSSTALLYSNGVIFGDAPGAGSLLTDAAVPSGQVTFRDVLTLERTVLTSGVVARKDALLHAGGFDEAFHRAEDFDLWLRVLKTGGKIVYNRQPLLRYRRREVSLSGNAVALRMSAVAVLEKAKRIMELTSIEQEALRESVLKLQADAEYFTGAVALDHGDIPAALRGFEESNRYRPRMKLTILVLLLRYFPALTTAMIKFRRRIS